MNYKSYIHKVKDIRIVSGTFKNDEGNDQDYKSIQLVVLSDGVEETLPLSGASATKPKTLELSLKGADNLSTDNNSGFLE